jgi:(p)ppGpp synthase/HD superfamily hydrolase
MQIPLFTVKMSDIYTCNWKDCLQEGKKREIIWHILRDHIEERRVPFHCTLCHYRAGTFRILERHVHSYGQHLELMGKNEGEMLENFLIVSEDPYFVNVGTDTSTCDAVLKIMNETSTTESEIEVSEIEIIEFSHEFDICDVSCQTEDNYETNKAEINVLKGAHQAELNRFADFIARKEQKLSQVDEENNKLKFSLKERDAKLRVLERYNRHKAGK